jgi:O-antigen biosynthesis protein WbqV
MRFKAVRLGNVLASEGSVLPLFQSQIDRGEPLSVTHPQASRYFLTMQNAAQLLLLALSSNFAPGILVPDLGEPIRIEEIAQSMLASEKEGSQSRIVYTGLRPGDKLTEKLVSDAEVFLGKSEALLRPIHSEGPSLIGLQSSIQEIEEAVQQRNLPRLVRAVVRLVPDYQPSAIIQSALEERTPEEQVSMRANR